MTSCAASSTPFWFSSLGHLSPAAHKYVNKYVTRRLISLICHGFLQFMEIAYKHCFYSYTVTQMPCVFFLWAHKRWHDWSLIIKYSACFLYLWGSCCSAAGYRIQQWINTKGLVVETQSVIVMRLQCSPAVKAYKKTPQIINKKFPKLQVNDFR